jgi:hypothetical protein
MQYHSWILWDPMAEVSSYSKNFPPGAKNIPLPIFSTIEPILFMAFLVPISCVLMT